MDKKGFLISFEGLDGSSKSTQLALLHTSLAKRGLDAIATAEPYDDKLRYEIFLTKNESTRLLLFLADRAMHVEKVIKPLLEAGNIVLCDRFIDSTLAYQHYGAKLNRDFIDTGNRLAVGDTWPDLTFLLQAPIDVLEKRVIARGRPEGYDNAAFFFREKVNRGYLIEAHAYAGRIQVIDADRQPQVIAAQILAIVLKKLGVE